ncbi:MAG: LamG domain-containing protein [Patescibacteria group bacterium]|nr:LamG domain-containing protein [Patescibacteria group bacterium]
MIVRIKKDLIIHLKKFFPTHENEGRNFWHKGQSLMEILVGLGIIMVLMGASTYALVATLRTSTVTDQMKTAGLIGNSLMDSAITLAEGKWDSVYGLAKGSTNHYFIATSPTTTPYVVAGDESVLSDNITNGLVGHWKFDEISGTTAYDSSGNGNNGNLINSPTRMTSANCKVGSCLQFNGSNNAVDVGSGSSLDMSSVNKMTFSMWVKPTSYPVGSIVETLRQYNDFLMSWRGDSGGFWQIGITQSNSTKAVVQSATSATIPINTWTFVSMTADGSYVRLYINGTFFGLTTYDGTLGNIGGYSTIIGAYRNDGSRSFPGLIDDVRIYNRALSASEVAQLYNSAVYNRYFYVDNVNRKACGTGDITTDSTNTCTGSANDVQEDPSTQKITVGTYWNVKGASQIFENSEYVTRWENSYADQSVWNGSSGVAGPVNNFGSNFYDYSNISTTTTGAIKITGF